MEIDEIMGLGDEQMEVIALTEIPDARSFLATSFSDYTVTEGLLLSLFLIAIGMLFTRFFKGGY